MSIDTKKYDIPSNPEKAVDGVGFAFIKPGFESVYPGISRDFSENGLEIIQAQSLVLDPEVIDYIYRDSAHEHFYETMKQHLASNPVIVMAITGLGRKTQEKLHDLKTGGNNTPNLRTRYQRHDERLSDEELRIWEAGQHPRQAETTIRLTQNNVFHAADDTADAVRSLARIQEKHTDFFQSPEDAATRRKLSALSSILSQNPDLL